MSTSFIIFHFEFTISDSFVYPFRRKGTNYKMFPNKNKFFLDFSKFSRTNRSFARSFVRSAGISEGILAENENCLLDLYNARANLDFLRMFFAANFNPVKKSKSALTSYRINLQVILGRKVIEISPRD